MAESTLIPASSSILVWFIYQSNLKNPEEFPCKNEVCILKEENNKQSFILGRSIKE